MNESAEVDEASVVSCCKAAEMFEASEAALDLVPMLVDDDVVGDGYLAVPLRRDHGLCLHVRDVRS